MSQLAYIYIGVALLPFIVLPILWVYEAWGETLGKKIDKSTPLIRLPVQLAWAAIYLVGYLIGVIFLISLLGGFIGAFDDGGSMDERAGVGYDGLPHP